MTIWILALILFASLVGLGYRQGAIRVAASLIGILLGALLAAPLAKLVKPVLSAVGIKNPTWLWLLAPVVAFLIVLVLFKIVGSVVHQKVEVYYKYKAGDLRYAMWQRIVMRLGACLGLVNATAYLVLIATVVYPFSY